MKLPKILAKYAAWKPQVSGVSVRPCGPELPGFKNAHGQLIAICVCTKHGCTWIHHPTDGWQKVTGK